MKKDKDLEAIDKKIAEMKVKWGEKESTPKDSNAFDHFNNLNIWSRIKAWYSPSTTVLVNMELRSGKHRYFTINTRKDSFTFMGGEYIIDPSLMYFLVDAKMSALDYHQDFSLPIKREFNPRELKAAINSINIVEVENATNPLTLQNFIESKVAEGVMRGQAIDEFLRRQKTMVIIILITVVVHLAIYLVKSGALSGLSASLG